MPRKLDPLPRNLAEVDKKLIKVDIPSEDTVFSTVRGKDIARNNDKIKDITVGVKDIDEAILYYFENVIKPTVVQNNQQVKVPVIYGFQERWKAVQVDGFYRDKNGKVMAPLIMVKRDTIEKNRELGNKLDGNKSHLFQVFQTQYNQKNQYDAFSILNNRQPSKQYYVSVVPDYVTITYECIIFTNYIEQNNKLIEAIEFTSDSYWGDYNKFHFRSNIDSFGITNIIEQGEDRVVKTNFNIKVNGYIIPNNVQTQFAGIDMFYSPAQIIFDLETVNSSETLIVGNNKKQVTNSTSFVGGGNNILNSTTLTSNVRTDDLIYLSTSITITANSSNSDQSTFNNYNILQVPAGSSLPQTGLNNFSFFINGQYVPNTYVLSVVDSGNNILVTFDTASMGYTLDTIDTVIGVGKFVAV